MVKLHDPNFNRLRLIHPCDRWTDRRTGDSIARYSIYAVERQKDWSIWKMVVTEKDGKDEMDSKS